MAFLLLDKSPNFISLNVANRNVDNLLFHQSRAAGPDHVEQVENGVTMNFRNALCRADRIALNQELDAQLDSLSVKADFLLFGDESFWAGVATVTLIARTEKANCNEL